MASTDDLAMIWRQRREFAGTDHPGLRLNNLTTTQRDALTGSGAAKTGDLIFNTTTGTFEPYNGASWGPLTSGTVTTSATTSVMEYGDGVDHVTRLVLTSFAVGTGGDATNLAIGAQVYTFGSGAVAVFDGTVSGIFDQASHGTITGGEVGLGTTTGTGASATLSSTMEDIFDGGNGGVLSSYVLGTGVVNAGGNSGGSSGALKIATAGTKSVFLNIAAAWPNIAAPEAVTFTGVITLRWRKIS